MTAHEVSIRERVKKPPSAAMVRSYYRPSLDYALANQFGLETWVHLAHCRMLLRQGIIAEAEARSIERALLDLHEAGPDALAIDDRLEDMYSYVERHLTATLGPETGGRLHTGRSRNDLHVTTWRMTLRGLMLGVMESLNALRRATLDQARRHAAIVMPGYTHWQHAQPVTFGYYLLAFADVLARDFTRCQAAYAHTNLSPLGAGALTTTAFPLDREGTAAALGFEGLVEVAYDAVASRDDAHESAAAFAVLMTNLSRLAVDLQAWSTYEYGFVILGDEHCAVSSIMPQKKNPATLEHIKAAAAMVTGALTASLAASKNTAFADVSDGVTALNAPVVDAAGQTRRVLDLAAELIAALTIAPERMADFAARGFGTATELADVIVRGTGLSFRMAHNVVATVVSAAIDAGRAATDITSSELDDAAQALFGCRLCITEEALAGALDPSENVRRRRVTGGPAPANMAAMLTDRDAKLRTAIASVAQAAARVEQARESVFADARCFV